MFSIFTFRLLDRYMNNIALDVVTVKSKLYL